MVTMLVTMIISVSALQGVAPTHECIAGEVSPFHKIRAVKVHTRPWLGRHQVYGTFVIPIQYRSSRRYAGQLRVESFTDVFNPDGQPLTHALEGVTVGMDQYVVRAYMSTRAAFGFLFSGRFGDLQSPCNWSIELFDRWAQPHR